MKIQNNYACRPNFGMAMRITPKAEKYLQNESFKNISDLKEIGQSLKNTKYWHLEIGENLTPKIDSNYADAYLPDFIMAQPKDEFLTVYGNWVGTSALHKTGQRTQFDIKFDSKEQACAAFDKISSMKSEPHQWKQAAELVKVLDEATEKKFAAEATEKRRRAEIEKFAGDLIKEFGGEAHVRP